MDHQGLQLVHLVLHKKDLDLGLNLDQDPELNLGLGLDQYLELNLDQELEQDQEQDQELDQELEQELEKTHLILIGGYKMEYDIGIRLDAMNEKLDMILVKLYPEKVKKKEE